MYLDLSCPLELLSFELSRDDHGKIRAYLHLNNLSSRRIARIEGQVHWLDSKTGGRQVAPFVADQLRTQSQRPFKIQLSYAGSPGIDGLEMVFDRLGFTDGGPDWLGDENRLCRIEPPPLPEGAELNLLLRAAGRDAQHFPVKIGEYWLCVCGRPNGTRSARCARCHRPKAKVLGRYARGKVVSGETPGVHRIARKVEIPRLLPNARARDREAAERVVDGLAGAYRAQRRVLVRRSVFLAVAVVVVVAVVGAYRWLGEKSEEAKGMYPPARVESTAPPR